MRQLREACEDAESESLFPLRDHDPAIVNSELLGLVMVTCILNA